eukprot:2380312-Lingulodinium_polyedra.AAC.1
MSVAEGLRCSVSPCEAATAFGWPVGAFQRAGRGEQGQASSLCACVGIVGYARSFYCVFPA